MARLDVRGCSLGLTGLIVMLGVGCNSLKGIRETPVAAIESVERAQASTPAAKKPGGYDGLRVANFLFFADVPLEANDALFRELQTLPDQISRELELPPTDTLVHVYLFEDQTKYESYMKQCFPNLPIRRAYFIASKHRGGAGDELQIFTWMGENLRTDLRHELTHALLHGSVKRVPLWLDEGLAGYFEQSPEASGVNTDHLERLRKGPFTPNLARLEKITEVKQMEKAEYRESWAWVHFLLRSDTRAKTTLITYLKQHRDDPNPGSLLVRLEEAMNDPHRALADHLTRIELPSPTLRTVRAESP